MSFARRTIVLVTLSAVGGLAACGHKDSAPGDSAHRGTMTMRDGQIAISAAGGEALVSAEGRLAINGAPVAVSEGQRAELANYYKAAAGVVQHSVDTGAAGAAVGVTAATGVVSGIAKGDMSDMKAKIEAQAEAVRREALKICDSLEEARGSQDRLAAQLDAFKPYAVISARETADCARDLRAAPKN